MCIYSFFLDKQLLTTVVIVPSIKDRKLPRENSTSSV